VSEATLTFNDSAEYERFMGRWSRAVAPIFLRWMQARRHARWLDVGCGTGILTQTLVELCAPSSVHAIDCSAAQVKASARATPSASFQVADARELPFPDASFDVVASALVINFIADPATALAEMRRVVRTGGLVAGYVWDFAQDLSPSGPLRKAMRHMGLQVPEVPGTQTSRLEALRTLFGNAGLDDVEVVTIDVTLAYSDFEDFWEAQTPAYAATTKIVTTMTKSARMRLKRTVESSLRRGPNASIEYLARANAIRSHA